MEKKLESPANGIGRSRRKTSQIAIEKLKAQLVDESSDDETESMSSGTGYETDGSFVTNGSGSSSPSKTSDNESGSSSPARTYSSGYRTVNKSDTSDTGTDSDNEGVKEVNLPSTFIEPFPKRAYQKKPCRFPERPEASLCEERESRALETSFKNVHEKKQEKIRENPVRIGVGESRGRGRGGVRARGRGRWDGRARGGLSGRKRAADDGEVCDASDFNEPLRAGSKGKPLTKVQKAANAKLMKDLVKVNEMNMTEANRKLMKDIMIQSGVRLEDDDGEADEGGGAEGEEDELSEPGSPSILESQGMPDPDYQTQSMQDDFTAMESDMEEVEEVEEEDAAAVEVAQAEEALKRYARDKAKANNAPLWENMPTLGVDEDHATLKALANKDQPPLTMKVKQAAYSGRDNARVTGVKILMNDGLACVRMKKWESQGGATVGFPNIHITHTPKKEDKDKGKMPWVTRIGKNEIIQVLDGLLMFHLVLKVDPNEWALMHTRPAVKKFFDEFMENYKQGQEVERVILLNKRLLEEKERKKKKNIQKK